jgi:hypothetical protein
MQGIEQTYDVSNVTAHFASREKFGACVHVHPYGGSM